MTTKETRTIKLVKGTKFIGEVEIPKHTYVVVVHDTRQNADVSLNGVYVRGGGIGDWYYFRSTLWIGTDLVKLL